MVNIKEKIEGLLARKNKTIDSSMVGIPVSGSGDLDSISEKLLDNRNLPMTGVIKEEEKAVLSVLSAGRKCKKGDDINYFVHHFLTDFYRIGCGVEAKRSEQITEMTCGYISREAMLEKERIRGGVDKAELKGLV